MAGSGGPPDWLGDDPYYDTHGRVRLDPFGNRYISRPDASPSDRFFGTSPYYEDHMQMPGFPQHSMFENYPDFPPMPSDPAWSDFGSEFRQSRPQTPSSAPGLRRIPIQVVKHPVTVIPSTCTSTSQNPPISGQTVSSGSGNFEHPKSAQNVHPSPTEVDDGISNRDAQIRREWHQPGRFKPEDHISYQNNGTAPCFAQDMFSGKDFPSSASETDYISHTGDGSGGGQFRPVKVHRIPISREDKPGAQPDRTDFDSLKPPMPDGTAIPVHYQSLPNRPFVTPRDLPAYGRTPSPAMRPEPPISESEITTPAETAASPMPTPKPTLTPSEQIDQALADLMEIRARIDAFSSSTKDKTYLYLEDRLDKMLLKFDGIDTGGEEAVRQKRKQAVRETLDAISMLEKKLASSDQVNNNSSSTPVVKTADTSAPNESLDSGTESKPTTQESESVTKTETEVKSGAKAEAEKPTEAMEVGQQSENTISNDSETPVLMDTAEPTDYQETTVNHTNNGNTDGTVAPEPTGD